MVGVADPLDATLGRRNDEGKLFAQVRQQFYDLEGQLQQRRHELTTLQERQADTDALDLLDALPTASGRLGELPQPVLRRLFQAFHLKVEYDRHTNWATIEVTLRGDDIDELQQAAAAILHTTQIRAEAVKVDAQRIEQSSVAHALGPSPVTTMDKGTRVSRPRTSHVGRAARGSRVDECCGD